jgi:regulator of nonsense transcripts 2
MCLNSSSSMLLQEDREEVDSNANSKGISVWDGGNNASNADYNGPFGDLESRAFYEDLPDLLAMVPLNLLGLTPEQAAALQEQWRIERESRYTGPPPAVIPIGNDVEGKESSETSASSSSNSNLEALEASSESSATVDKKQSSAGDLQDLEKDDSTSASAEETPHMRVMLLIQDKLPECTNRAKCDEFCQNFCFLNSKSARKKLAQALVKIPWGRGELVSCYSRIIASLHRIFNDIAPVVLDSIQREITFLTRTKALLSANQIDSKAKILRYLCELVKFNVAPPIMVLKPCKAFLADFSSHNIDFLSVILESCGRYLYVLSYTSERMETIIDTMLRLRRSKFLDLRQQTLIDSAYFAVKPPQKLQNKKKELTLVQKYIRYLLLDRLCSKSVNVDNLIISIRRLPFNNPAEEVDRYIIKYALRLARQKYNSIGAIADLFSGIKRFKPNLVIQLIDALYEEVYRGLDSPYKRDYQRMIGYVRLIGELYNYEVLSSTTIFELLYLCLLYGHSQKADNVASGEHLSYTSTVYAQMISQNSELAASSTATADVMKLDKFIDRLRMLNYDPSRLDPRQSSSCEIDSPNDLFRAQLVVELINTCGEYYTKGQAKDKLNRFLAYFQRYLMCKQAVPLHIEFMILDMFDGLEAHALQGQSNSAKGKANAAAASPSATAFTRYTSLESVQAVIDDLESKNKAKDGMMSNEDGDEGSGDDEGNRHGHVDQADDQSTAAEQVGSDGEGSVNEEGKRGSIYLPTSLSSSSL